MAVIHYATYFDRHYLTRGLALYRSLRRHSPPFLLWVLCLDGETHRTLSRLRLDGVALVPLAQLEDVDDALLAVKPSRQPAEYYWTCGPAFLLSIFEQSPWVGTLTYLDADMYCFGDPTPVFRELESRSVAIVEHRRASISDRALHEYYASHGTYNVGLLVFRRTADGLACLRWWRERCLEWCFDREEPGRFGDQVYLDEFATRFPGVVALQHPGAGRGPWNLGNHNFRPERGRILVNGQPLLVYHFAHFRIVTRWLYDPGFWRYHIRPAPAVRRALCVPYARELRAADRMVRGAGGRVYSVDGLRYGRSRTVSLKRMVRNGSFLVVTDTLAL